MTLQQANSEFKITFSAHAILPWDKITYALKEICLLGIGLPYSGAMLYRHHGYWHHV